MDNDTHNSMFFRKDVCNAIPQVLMQFNSIYTIFGIQILFFLIELTVVGDSHNVFEVMDEYIQTHFSKLSLRCFVHLPCEKHFICIIFVDEKSIFSILWMFEDLSYFHSTKLTILGIVCQGGPEERNQQKLRNAVFSYPTNIFGAPTFFCCTLVSLSHFG